MLENASQQHGLNSNSLQPLLVRPAAATKGTKLSARWVVCIGSFALSKLAAGSVVMGRFGVSVLATLARVLGVCLSCRAGIHAQHAAGSGSCA
jgi:hypothetical protein